jgi:hypothetical protein
MIYGHPVKIEFPYFSGYVFRTNLLYVIVLPDGVSRTFQYNNDNFIIWCVFGSTIIILYFPPLSCCTSRHHNIILPFVITLYFRSWLIFMQNYEGSYTSLNWVSVHFVLTIVYFWSPQCCTSCYEFNFYTYLQGTVCTPLDLIYIFLVHPSAYFPTRHFFTQNYEEPYILP